VRVGVVADTRVLKSRRAWLRSAEAAARGWPGVGGARGGAHGGGSGWWLAPTPTGARCG